jgi:uncharacterized protein YraI
MLCDKISRISQLFGAVRTNNMRYLALISSRLWLLGLLAVLAWAGQRSSAAPLNALDGTFTVTSPVGGGFTYPGAFHTLTVVDGDNNVTPGPGNDIVNVTYYNGACAVGAITNVPLLESSTTAGTFSAVFQNVALANQPICFRYVDTPNAGGGVSNRDVIFNTIGTQASISSTSAGTPGTVVTITVVDADRNLHSGNGNDTITIQTRNTTTGAGAVENVVLNEVGAGTFQGTLSNIDPLYGPPPAGNIIPNVGDIIEFSYADTFRPLAAPATVSSTHTVRGTDATLQVTPTTVSRGGVLTITVTDADENRTAGGSNDIIPAARVGVDNNGAVETLGVQLNETATAGVFQGTFQLASFVTPPIVSPPPIVVRYVDDGTSAGGGPVNRTVNVTVVAYNGTLTLSSNSISTGGSIDMTVTDFDLNLGPTPGAPDTVNVEVQEIDAAGVPVGAPVIKPVPETATQGVFLDNYTFVELGVDFPGVAAGDRFRVRYVDAENSTGAPANRDRVFQVVTGTNVVTFTAVPDVIEPGESFTITLCDTDLDVTAGGGNDTATVFLDNPSNSAAEFAFNLTETATAGCFTGTVVSSMAGLEATYNQRIDVRYPDTPTGGGAPVNRVVSVFVRFIGNDSVLYATDTIPGRPIYVTLFEPDRPDFTGVIDILAQNITTGGQAEVVSLRYAGSRGRFIGSIATAFAQTDDGVEDKIINVRPGDIVRFTYFDQFNTTGFDQFFTADSRIRSRSGITQVCNQQTSTSAPVWRGEYFPNTGLTGNAFVTIDEPSLNINWEETAPFRDFPVDRWSARFTTNIEVLITGKFRFRAGADDGVRLFVNDQVVIDQFSPGPFRQHTADVTMRQGTNRLRVEYLEDSAVAGIIVDCTYLEGMVTAIDPQTGAEIDVLPSDVNFEEAVAHMTTGRINVRANPTIQSPTIERVFIYQRYPIRGLTEDGQWTLIQLKDGRTGWVSSQFVRRYENTPVQIFPNFAGTETTLPNVEVTGYATAELKIRVAPRNGEQLGILPAGASFRILSRTQNSAWYRITFEGIEGWVYAPFVDLTNGDVMDLRQE